MIAVLQILALLTVSMAMALALAHALEFPGKLRLSRAEYETVQEIYYPGFTYGGAGEAIALLLLLTLLLVGPWQGTTFWLTLAAWLTLSSCMPFIGHSFIPSTASGSRISSSRVLAPASSDLPPAGNPGACQAGRNCATVGSTRMSYEPSWACWLWHFSPLLWS